MPQPRDVERIHEVPLERINAMFVANEGLCLDCGFRLSARNCPCRWRRRAHVRRTVWSLMGVPLARPRRIGLTWAYVLDDWREQNIAVGDEIEIVTKRGKRWNARVTSVMAKMEYAGTDELGHEVFTPVVLAERIDR